MKLLTKFLFLFSLLLLFLIKVPPASAATCDIKTNPPTVTTNERTINVEIETTGLVEGNEYWARLNEAVIGEAGKGGFGFKVVNGKISIQNLNSQGFLNPPSGNPRTFEAKTYTITVQEPSADGVRFCSPSFPVVAAASGGTCKIEFINPSDKFTPNNDISINVTSLGGNSGDGRRIVIKRNKENEKDYRTFNTSVGELSSGFNIGKFESGVYYLEVRSGQDFFANRDCYTNFGIGDKEGGFGPQPGPIASPPPICQGGFCETALGKIFTDPANFVKAFFGILLSLAGGIALILIIISGYRLMATGGNPEKVQQARDQLTSAIVGLLFIIFSLSILQIIGVDILRIPGLR